MKVRAIFKGQVQGVGFRWQVADHAEKLKIVGRIKNLSNGSVEVTAEGSQEALETFLKVIQADSGAATISSVSAQFSEKAIGFTDFQILF